MTNAWDDHSASLVEHPTAHVIPPKAQRGFALLAIAALLVVLGLSMLMATLNSNDLVSSRRKITERSLNEAKEALIGFAANVDLSGSTSRRPGDLPCPDQNNDGLAETTCGNAAGTTGQALRLGRLPWRTLGLPDLRDGSGERLWYAVSNSFKNATRTPCASPGAAGCLNSDTNGAIAVRSSSGALTNDPSSGSGVIALVIAPGSALTRQGGYSQNRECTTCDANRICDGTPASAVPYCNPLNFLDDVSGIEDNADFQDGTGNGFIQGPILANGTTVLNDQIAAITTGEMMPAIERRVAGETLRCLNSYASANAGRYPWAAPLNPLGAVTFDDVVGTLSGRVPDTPFTATQTSSGNAMTPTWTGACYITSTSGWWLNWKEQVFYALGSAVQPGTGVPTCTAGTCLTVNAGTVLGNRNIAILAAGRRLPSVAGGQPRTGNAEKGTIGNYLEGHNATFNDGVLQRTLTTSDFNDIVLTSP